MENKLNLFKKIALIVALCFCVPMAMASKNIKLEKNAANCKKIDGFGTNDRMAIATSFKVSISSVRFLRAQWGPGRYGNADCEMIFDTAAGPKRCQIIDIMSDDGGKTAFALVDPYNIGRAHVCY